MARSDSPDFQLRQAIQAHQSGRFQEAESLYKAVLRVRPRDAETVTNLGLLFAQTGRKQEAATQFETAVSIDPDSALLRTYYGHALRDLGNLEEATLQYTKSVQLDPKSAAVSFVLGNILLKVGRVSEALEAYDHCLALDKRNPDVWLNHGMAVMQSGRPLDAVTSYRKAIQLNPKSAGAWLNLADTFLGLGDFENAIPAFETGLAVAPRDHDGWVGLATAMAELQQYGPALTAIQKALAIQSSSPKAIFIQAKVFQYQKRNDEAIEAYRKVIHSDAEQVTARINLAMILAEQGRWKEAKAEFAQVALKDLGEMGLASALRGALVVPTILMSNTEIDEVRSKLIRELNEISARKETVQNVQMWVGNPGFYFAYQGRNNRELLTTISQTLSELTPDLVWAPPAAKQSQAPKTGRLRIAFISAHLREHTVGRINIGLIEKLDRRQFEVIVIRPKGSADAFSSEIDRHADRVVEVPNDFRLAREEISHIEPDVIYYPDIGMEPFSYYLAHSRLAPVQCAGWGHADTTGIKNIDYYVSSEHFEPINGQEFYSEKLLKLGRINNYFPQPDAVYENVTRQQLGLPETGALYLCPQSAFKLHPDFDEALREILVADASGIVAISSGTEEHWNDLLRERFSHSIGDLSKRIVFLPRVPSDQFRGLLALADVMIDPIHFTGGHTIYMAFSVGTPVVTWEGERMSGRMTRGLYSQMDFQGPVAKNAKDYAQLAVEIATDKEVRALISRAIKVKSAVLFEDIQAVRDFGQALQEVYRLAVG